MEPVKGNIFGGLISARYLLALLASIGLGIVYGLKVNLHVTIISMVNNTAIRLYHEKQATTNLSSIFSMPKITEDVCTRQPEANASNDDGPFEWSQRVQGAVLSAYFWGYMAAQMPGGATAERFSAKWTLFGAVAVDVVGALLTPFLARLHYAWLLVVRLVQGAGGGVTFPAAHVLLAHWAPPSERTVLSTVVYSGTALGTVVFMLASGVIASSMGWAAVFYLQGGICCAWLILWAIFVSDSPETQTMISEEERKFILESLKDGNKKNESYKRHGTPWRSILTSRAFLAILVAHVCSNWGWYMVLVDLPLYFKDVLDINIKESALLTSAPFFFMWLFSMLLSRTVDGLRAKKKLTTTAARKIATLISSVIPLMCFLLLSYIGCQKTLAIVLMTIAVTAIGGMFSGFISNHIDIAPNYAGTLVALTNTVATIPGILVPNFVGYLTATYPIVASWRIIFWTTIVMYLIEIVIYTTFGSGEVQSWNNPPDSVEAQPLNAASPTSEQKTYEATSSVQPQS